MLRTEQIQSYRITFSGTKRGKLKTVPILPEIYNLLTTKKRRRLFKPSYGSFRRQIAKSDLELPNGQLTHVCLTPCVHQSLYDEWQQHYFDTAKNTGAFYFDDDFTYAHLPPEYCKRQYA